MFSKVVSKGRQVQRRQTQCPTFPYLHTRLNTKGLPFYVQELECLQDHLDDLAVECRDIVGNLTELESEVSNK